MILNNIDTSSNNDNFFEVIHEVKNSIAVCRGYLDIIDSDRNNRVDSKYLSIIRGEIDRSSDIIGDFMLYKKTNVIKDIMDVNVLLNDFCVEFK